MNESGFTRSVNKLLPTDVDVWKINARYAGGVPDCWYSVTGGDLWVEFKYLQKITKTIKAKLSALQAAWLDRKHSQGRKVAVVVGSPQGSLILTDGEWNKRHIVTDLLSKKEVANWINKTTRETKV